MKNHVFRYGLNWMGFISKIKLKEVRSLMSVEDREISL
jgi:hypothetical protein